MAFLILLLPLIPSTPDTGMVMQKFLPSSVDAWSKSEPARRFRGREIFAYMDGAGEVYLAYQFEELLVQRYARSGEEEILVEVFDMGSDRNAFGISTYMRGRGPAVRIGQDGEYKSGLLCFWRSRYYVCVRIERENPQGVRALRKMGNVIAEAIGEDGKRPAVLGCLPKNSYRPESLRYFFRDEILRAHLTLPKDNLLLLTDSTEGLLVRIQHERSKLLVIKYPRSGDAATAACNFAAGYAESTGEEGTARSANNTWAAWGRKGSYVLVVIDAASRERARNVLTSVQRRIQ